MASDLWEKGEKMLDSYISCQFYKNVSDSMNIVIIHSYDVKKAFEFWEIDFVDSLVKIYHGYKYIIIMIDYFTSRAFAWSLEERSAATAIEILEEIIWTHGKSAEIIIDNGEEFRSQEFQAILKWYDIQHNWMSSDHSQINSKMKRLNHELMQWL